MDFITTAIVAAVTAGVKETGKKAISDAYQGLKRLIQSKFGKDNNISKAIDELEDTPDSEGRKMVLAENMGLEKADKDSDLIKIAQQLVQALKETEQGRQVVAKYQIDAKGAQVGVMGDRAKVEGGMHFGGSKK